MDSETLKMPPPLAKGPVGVAWGLSLLIHAAVLAAPLGLALRAPESLAPLQVKLAARASAEPTVVRQTRDLPDPPAERNADRPASRVTESAPVMSIATAAEPAFTVARAEVPPVAEAPIASSEKAIAAPEKTSAVIPSGAASERSSDASRHAVLVPPRYDAAYLDNPPPAYPRMARQRGEQGTVIVVVEVGADGRPMHCALHRSSGFASLDEAALKTVRSWRFVPARRGEQTVAETVLVPMPFRLTDSATLDTGTDSRAS